MTQEQQDRILADGTADDANELAQHVLNKHPKARELNKITAGTEHRLWLDETTEALLFLEREKPDTGTPDRLRLHRIPVRSATCPQVMADLTAPVLARLAAPKGTYHARPEANQDLGALVQLFRVQLTRLRTEHRDRPTLVKAIHAQIGKARDKQQVERRTAFLGWYLEHIYGYRSGVCREAAEDLADGVETDGGTQLDLDDFGRAIGQWESYRYGIRRKAPLPGLEPPWKRLRRGDLHWYYEFRTLGRRLTEQQMLELRAALPWAEVTPDTLVLDRWDNGDHPISNQASKFMAEYFDAGLHFDQSGTRILWLRIPATLADQIAPFEHQLAVEVEAAGDDLVLQLLWWGEDGENMYERCDPSPWLRELLPLRDDVACGDLRAVAIAWRAAVNWQPPDDKWAKWLSMPDGLDEDELTPQLHAVVELLEEVY